MKCKYILIVQPATVDAEAEDAEALIFMWKLFPWCQYLQSEYQFEHLKWGTKAN